METISRHLDDLIVFYVVAELGSFTKAALQLGTSKSAVSKQIKRLETQLNVNLLYRTTRSLNLTREGKDLFEYSRKIVDISDDASRYFREISRVGVHELKITLPLSFAPGFISSFLTTLPASLESTRIEVDASTEIRDFIKDEIDFAIRSEESQQPDLIVRYLGKMKDVICASPLFLRKNPVSEDPQELTSKKCIVHRFSHEKSIWNLVSPKKEIQIELKGHYVTNQYVVARTMCLAGLGIARLPYYLVADDLKEGRLVHLYRGYAIATHAYYLIYHKKNRTSQKHQLFKQHLLRWFKERTEIFI
jgi:DNA-binding transcriptional LysR family regulator